tara:strand:- start:2361 stop:3365 length:1005 start_codon:yes stop_codon:yes gene_type:complete
MGFQTGLAWRPQQEREGNTTKPTAVDKILDKIAPSEATRGKQMGKSFMSDYYGMSLSNVDKMFSIDADGNLGLAMDKDDNVLGKAFPGVKDAFDDYSRRAKEHNIEPNLQEFGQMYTTNKQIYDQMLSNKLNTAMAKGFTQNQVITAMQDDPNFEMSNYINANQGAVDSQGMPLFGNFSSAAAGDRFSVMDAIVRGGREDALVGGGMVAYSKKAKGAQKRIPKEVKEQISKWGFKMKGRGKNATIDLAKTKKPKGVGRFLSTMSKLLPKGVAGKAVTKVATKLALYPAKALLGPLGWALIARDVYQLTMGDMSIIKAVQSSWNAEMGQQTNSQF